MIPGTRTPSRRTARSGLLTTVVITVSAMALAGCSGASNPSAGTGSTPSPTLSAPPPPPPPERRHSPERVPSRPPLSATPRTTRKGSASWITAQTPANLTPEQQVVLQAWTRYWQFAMQAYNTRGMNLSSPEAMKSLDGVSTGQARPTCSKGYPGVWTEGS